MGFVKRFFNDESLHLEQARATRAKARDYCRKEDTRIDGPWEHGDFDAGGQGKRNDILTIWDRDWETTRH